MTASGKSRWLAYLYNYKKEGIGIFLWCEERLYVYTAFRLIGPSVVRSIKVRLRQGLRVKKVIYIWERETKAHLGRLYYQKLLSTFVPHSPFLTPALAWETDPARRARGFPSLSNVDWTEITRSHIYMYDMKIYLPLSVLVTILLYFLVKEANQLWRGDLWFSGPCPYCTLF